MLPHSRSKRPIQLYLALQSSCSTRMWRGATRNKQARVQKQPALAGSGVAEWYVRLLHMRSGHDAGHQLRRHERCHDSLITYEAQSKPMLRSHLAHASVPNPAHRVAAARHVPGTTKSVVFDSVVSYDWVLLARLKGGKTAPHLVSRDHLSGDGPGHWPNTVVISSRSQHCAELPTKWLAPGTSPSIKRSVLSTKP